MLLWHYLNAPAQAHPPENQAPTESARGELFPTGENGAGGDCSLNSISTSPDFIYALRPKMERPDTSRRQWRQLTAPFTIGAFRDAFTYFPAFTEFSPCV